MSNMYWTFYPGKDYAKAMILLKRIDKAELGFGEVPGLAKGRAPSRPQLAGGSAGSADAQ